MLTSNIKFTNFQTNNKNKKLLKIFKNLKNDFFKNKKDCLLSLSKKYKHSFELKSLKKYNKYKFFRIVGMGGSILGTQAIYSFLKFKIKKIFFFTNNLNLEKKR